MNTLETMKETNICAMQYQFISKKYGMQEFLMVNYTTRVVFYGNQQATKINPNYENIEIVTLKKIKRLLNKLNDIGYTVLNTYSDSYKKLEQYDRQNDINLYDEKKEHTPHACVQ